MRHGYRIPFAGDRCVHFAGGGRPRVAVIGAGNGGLAMAGHLALNGLDVTLYSRSEEKIAPVRAEGGIHVRGAVNGFGRLHLATSCIEEGAAAADVIMVTTPASAHAAVAEQLAPWMDGHIVVLNPGRTGGALEVHHIFQNRGARAVVVEAQTFIYASRAESPTEARIYEVKRDVPVAAFPSVATGGVLKVLKKIFPQFSAAVNVLQTSFSNIGAIFHPVPLMMNACRVEQRVPFEYYREGITPAIAELLERLDEERVAVAAALGVRVPTAREWLYRAYRARGRNLYEAIQNNKAYEGLQAPQTLNHRYIHEDVPTGLVPIASFGRAVGVPTPFIDAMIRMASAITGIETWENGRTVERLGLAGLSADAITHYVTTGVKHPVAAGIRRRRQGREAVAAPAQDVAAFPAFHMPAHSAS